AGGHAPVHARRARLRHRDDRAVRGLARVVGAARPPLQGSGARQWGICALTAGSAQATGNRGRRPRLSLTTQIVLGLAVGLVLGLGRLDRAQAVQLAKYGLLTLLAFWLMALAVVGAMPLAFPEYKAAFFFSTTLLEQPEPLSFVDLYIPANPFHSLANSIVP